VPIVAQRYEVHLEPIICGEDTSEQAAWRFRRRVSGRENREPREREIEKLHAKVDTYVERDVSVARKGPEMNALRTVEIMRDRADHKARRSAAMHGCLAALASGALPAAYGRANEQRHLP